MTINLPGMGLREPLTAFLLFVFVGIPVSAQEYSYARYDVKDGLVGSVVYHGLEDKDGFLWFATETGVSRFDGTHFKNFTTQDGLPDNEILRLFVDSKQPGMDEALQKFHLLLLEREDL